jgi:hypothetical protein
MVAPLDIIFLSDMDNTRLDNDSGQGIFGAALVHEYRLGCISPSGLHLI